MSCEPLGETVRRRDFITLLGGMAAAWPLATPHQTLAQNAPRVGWIFPGGSAGNPTELAGFKEGLRELGYVEGKNIVVEYRFGENSVERLPEFATELARLNVSVIVAIGNVATRVTQRAVPDTPIVFLVADPIGTGHSEQPEPARRQYHWRFGDAPEREVAGVGEGYCCLGSPASVTS